MPDQEEQVETRELIEEIVNENPQEEPIENEDYRLTNVGQQVKPIADVKPKAKSKAKAKPKAKVKIIKETVIETVIEPVEPEPVIEEVRGADGTPTERGNTPFVKPQVDKLKEIVKCPDCNVSMSQHTLKYIHKKGDIVKQLLKKQLLNQNRKSQHNHLYCKSNQHQII